jgi:hypothetical protein
MRTAPPGLTELAAHRADELAPLLRSHVLPLFQVDDDEHPEFEATGVLVRFDGMHFLISAAHVFDELPSGVFLLTDSNPQGALKNSARLTIRPDGRSRNSDPLDIGSVLLSEEEADAVGRENFVDLKPRSRATQSKWVRRCLLIGYPAKDQWRDIDVAEYHLSQSYYNAPEVSDAKYARAGLCTTRNVVVDFNHRLIQGPKGRGGKPNFKGMSGAGIWEFDVHSEYDVANKPVLIGLMAGPAPKYKKALFGASVDALIQHIRAT